MAQYDITKYIEGIKGMDWHDMIANASRETERIANFSGRRKAQEPESKKYLLHLKEFLYFLRTSQIPRRLSEKEMKAYRDVAEILIKKNQWLSGVLDIFDQD